MPSPTARLARFVVEECRTRDLDVAELLREIRDEVEGQAKECRAHPEDFSSESARYYEEQGAAVRRINA